MKIILDFDDTIFNTHRFMQEFLKVFKKFDFTEEEFFNTYQESKKIVGGFSPKVTIDLLNRIKPFDKIEAEKKINLILSNSENFVYPDFFDFANNFNKKDLILLSFDMTNMQKIKIDNSKAEKFFEDVIITSRDKTEDMKFILEKYKDEKIFFIDDKTMQVNNIKNKFPEIITMKIKRPQGVDIMTNSKIVDYTVKNLNEVKKIINCINSI